MTGLGALALVFVLIRFLHDIPSFVDKEIGFVIATVGGAFVLFGGAGLLSAGWSSSAQARVPAGREVQAGAPPPPGGMMASSYCNQCGAVVPAAARFCASCGAPVAAAQMPPMPPPAPQYPYAAADAAPSTGPRTNGLAIASMVLGIVWVYWIGSILAVIFGHIALSQIRRTGGVQQGRGMAIAGVVLGWIGVATLVIVLIAAAADA